MCQNCKTKNLSCRYGLNVTFVESRPRRLPRVPAVEAANSSTVQFIPVSADSIATPFERNTTQDLPEPHQPEPNDTRPASPRDLVVESHRRAAAPRQQTSISSSSVSPRGQFGSPRYRLRAWSPTLSSPLSLFTWAQSQGQESRSLELSRRPESGSTGSSSSQERYEIDLLTYFRYQIAPRLDLGVGDSYYGVRVPHRAEHCPQLYHSILALSCAQRAVVEPSHGEEDKTMTRNYSLRAHETTSHVEDEDSWTIAVLLTLLGMIQTPPRLWGEKIAHLTSINVPEAMMLEGHWHMMARLLLATRLVGSSASTPVNLSLVIQGVPSHFSAQRVTHKQQLQQALSNLGRALMISPIDSQPRQAHLLPFNALWQSCWSDNQLWYSARNEEMRQIFEMEDDDVDRLLQPQQKTNRSPFPVIMFSNSCALLANLVHHLTALYLLQHKPRLIKAVAEIGSSSSPVWHLQRLIGIVASFNEADVLGHLVVAAVIYAARRLSHPAQLTVVVEILRKAEQTTAMQLEEEIQNAQAAYNVTARTW